MYTGSAIYVFVNCKWFIDLKCMLITYYIINCQIIEYKEQQRKTKLCSLHAYFSHAQYIIHYGLIMISRTKNA